MNGFFKFSLWVILLGAGLKFFGLEGFGLVLTGGSIFLIAVLVYRTLRKKNAENYDCGNILFDAKTFELPLLEEPADLLTAPELEAAIVDNEYQAVACKRSIIALMVVLGIIIFFVLGTFNGTMLIICGIIGCILVLINKLGQTLLKKKGAEYFLELEKQRDLLLAQYPRPKLDTYSTESLNQLSRYYETLAGTQIAVFFARLAGIDFMIYPGDSLRMISGRRYPEIRKIMQEQYQVKWLENTLRERINNAANHSSPHHVVGWLEDILRENARKAIAGSSLPPAIEQLPEPLNPVPEPPPTKFKPRDFDSTSKSLNEDDFIVEIKKRPEFDLKEFCSYWPSREEATAALAVRSFAIEIMYRPSTMMCYPNDPLALLIFIYMDSMEYTEFILAVEDYFGISISDAIAMKILTGFTFASFVEYVVTKQKENTRRPAK